MSVLLQEAAEGLPASQAKWSGTSRPEIDPVETGQSADSAEALSFQIAVPAWEEFMKSIAAFPALALVSAIAFWAACPGAAQEVVFLIRHAERDWSSSDAGLLAAGHERAAGWADVLADADLDVIITSEMLRTRETSAPISEALEVPVQVFTRYDVRGLIELLKTEHADERVLVVGHSSTIPQIIRALGAPDRISIPKSDYNDLFIVRTGIDGSASAVRLNVD